MYAKEGTKNQAVYYYTQRNMDLNVCNVLNMSYEHKLKTENIYSEILSLFKINVYYEVIMNYTGLIDNIKKSIFMLTCS